MERCIARIHFICLAEGLVQIITRRKLYDWIQKLVHGQESGVHKKFVKMIL